MTLTPAGLLDPTRPDASPGQAGPRCENLTGAMVAETSQLDSALTLAQAGDEAGFLELWRQLQPRLLRYLRVLGCPDADDVASET